MAGPLCFHWRKIVADAGPHKFREEYWADMWNRDTPDCTYALSAGASEQSSPGGIPDAPTVLTDGPSPNPTQSRWPGSVSEG